MSAISLIQETSSQTRVAFGCVNMAFENLKTLSFLIVQSIVVVLSASYYQKEYSGYLFTIPGFNNAERRTQAYAQTWCTRNGSRLLAITNASVQTAVVAFINDAIQQNQMTSDYIITDGRQSDTNNNWIWIDGSSSDTLSLDNDNNVEYQGSYVYLSRTSGGISLNAAQSTDTNYYICEFSGQTSCVNGYQNGGQCFQCVNDEAVTWYEARNRCLMGGGDLATFEFIKTNDDLNTLNGSWIDPATNYWIGLRSQWWTWQNIDSDVTYSQWSDDQPDFTQECLCLYPNDPVNDWKWGGCDYKSYQFVCIRAPTSDQASFRKSPSKIASSLISSSQSSSVIPQSSSSTTASQSETNAPSSTSDRVITVETPRSTTDATPRINNLMRQSTSSTVQSIYSTVLIVILIFASILLSRKEYSSFP